MKTCAKASMLFLRILKAKTTSFGCSGTLISSKHVLTAAHCCKKSLGLLFVQRRDVENNNLHKETVLATLNFENGNGLKGNDNAMFDERMKGDFFCCLMKCDQNSRYFSSSFLWNVQKLNLNSSHVLTELSKSFVDKFMRFSFSEEYFRLIKKLFKNMTEKTFSSLRWLCDCLNLVDVSDSLFGPLE